MAFGFVLKAPSQILIGNYCCLDFTIAGQRAQGRFLAFFGGTCYTKSCFPMRGDFCRVERRCFMKRFLDQLRKLSFLSLPLCFASFVFLDFSFRFFYRFAGSVSLFSIRTVAFTLGWSLAFTALIALLPRLGRRIAMMVSICFFALLAVTHGVMYNIFGHFFSFSDMNFAGDGAKFFSWSYLKLRKAFLLCVVFSILLMAIAAFLVGKPKEGSKRWKWRLAALGVALLSIIPIAVPHVQLLTDVMWWGNAYNPNSDREVYRNFTDPNRSLHLAGLYQYTFRNLTVSLGLGDRQDVEKLEGYYKARKGEISGENEMTGALAGKNLVMVMLESADTWLVTEEYMPNLYGLQQKSVDFTRFYTPLFLSAGTFNTEVISQTGLIPAVSGLPASAYSVNSFPLSLANLFEDAGYTSNSFHSASPNIYSRGTVHVNLGFEAYTNQVGMGMENYQLDSQMINGYDLMIPKEGNFFTFIITYSGHGPYTEEMKVISDPHYAEAKAAVERSKVAGSKENMEEYTHAVAHAMETDQFVGELLDRLQADGRLGDTALLFYADHYGKYMSDKEFLLDLKGISEENPDLYRTPCFLYCPGEEGRKIEKICSSTDLVPTLVNLFGLPASREYYAGDDIFGDKGGFVAFPNYEWLDESGYHDLNARNGEDEARAQEVRKRIDASADALKCNYFKSWEETDIGESRLP